MRQQFVIFFFNSTVWPEKKLKNNLINLTHIAHTFADSLTEDFATTFLTLIWNDNKLFKTFLVSEKKFKNDKALVETFLGHFLGIDLSSLCVRFYWCPEAVFTSLHFPRNLQPDLIN